MASSTSQSVAAPVVPGGYFAHMMPVAISLMKQLYTGRENTEDIVVEIMGCMMKKMKIHLMPWH